MNAELRSPTESGTASWRAFLEGEIGAIERDYAHAGRCIVPESLRQEYSRACG